MGGKPFVGGLSFTTSNDSLRGAFARYGTVQSAMVMTDRETQRSRGFGFVEMASQDEADRAIAGMNGANLDGRMIRVDKATPRGTAPASRGPRPMGRGGPVGLPALGDHVRGPRGRLAAASAEGVVRAAAEGVAASAEAHPVSVSRPGVAIPAVAVGVPSAVTKASGARAARNEESQQESGGLRTRDAATKTFAGKGGVRRVGLLTPLALAVLLVAVLAGPVSRVSAQPSSTRAPSDVSVTVGGRTVFTSGFTKW